MRKAWRDHPKLRIGAAFFVAIVVDLIQVGLGPVGAVLFLDEVVDVIAMGLISWAIGFHPLLLPTFVIELLPVADMLPTWTACTAAVIWLRRKQAFGQTTQPPIETTVTITPVDPHSNSSSQSPL